MGLIDSPLIGVWGRGGNLSLCLCECEALATLRHTNFGSSFSDHEYVRSLSLEAIWNCFKRTAPSYDLNISWRGTEGLSKKAYEHRDREGSNPCTILFYSTLFYTTQFYTTLFYTTLFYTTLFYTTIFYTTQSYPLNWKHHPSPAKSTSIEALCTYLHFAKSLHSFHSM